LRLATTAPAGGAQAWFDDVAMVEWDPWQPLAGLQELTLSVPNDLQWVQLRLPAATASLPLEWTRKVCLDPPLEP